MAKKLISLLLILALVLAPMTVFAQAADGDPQIAELVRQQYDAFAKSKDYVGADERALWDMVNHAMYGKGKDLVFGNNGSMTAVMLNSALYRTTVIEALTAAVTQMEWFCGDAMSLRGSAGWYDYQMKHSLGGYDENGRYRGSMLSDPVFTGSVNDNDIAMILVVGSATSRITLHRAEVTDDAVVYDVELYLADGFDFDNTYEDMEDLGFDVSLAEALTNLGKLLALGLIEEYKWYVDAGFQLTIPNQCSHMGNVYDWTFWDGVPVSSYHNEVTFNDAERVKDETEQSVYYRLDQTVRLLHDQPWVIQFEAESSSVLSLSSTADNTLGYPYLLKDSARGIQQNGKFYNLEAIEGGEYRSVGLTREEQYIVDTDSSYLSLHQLYSAEYIGRYGEHSYTYRLENHVNPNGTNMIHLYVDDEYVGPLDNCYLAKTGEKPKSVRKTSNGISGKDFCISYIGDRYHSVDDGIYSLTIWENGRGGNQSMIDDGTTVPPTCTSQGYFAYTCQFCHRQYPSDFVDPVDHRYEQNLELTWNVWNSTYNARVTCTDCGEAGPEHEFASVVRPDDQGYVQIRVHTDDLVRNSMSVTSHRGAVDLTIPNDDLWLKMLAVSYDADGRMADVQILSADSSMPLLLQDQTVKLFFLNKYNNSPLMPILEIVEG